MGLTSCGRVDVRDDSSFVGFYCPAEHWDSVGAQTAAVGDVLVGMALAVLLVDVALVLLVLVVTGARCELEMTNRRAELNR